MRIRPLLIAAVVAVLGIFAPSLASAAECTPGTDPVPATYASTYTRTIPAVGTETIPNPDYVAPWTETIEHPAQTEVVHHEATYKTVHHEAVTECWGVYKHWLTGKTKTSKVDLGLGWIKVGTENVVISPAWDEQALDQPAWDETRVIAEAWTETVEHQAVGTETIPNPDYQAERTETTDYLEQAPAGDGWTVVDTRELTPEIPGTDPVCTEDPVIVDPADPIDPVVPAPADPVEPVIVDPAPSEAQVISAPVAVQDGPVVAERAAAPAQDERLAETGLNGFGYLALSALAALLIAGGVTAVRASRRS